MLRRLITGLLLLVGLLAIIAVGGYFALKRPDIPYETLASRYETAASRYVDLPSGVRMHYQSLGNETGPVIVLLHGFSSSSHTWEPWAHELGGEYRLLAPDLPGHGLTRAPAGYQASVETFRDATAEFAQALQLTRFTLAGNSMGGNVAWEYALAHPEQLDALVLVNASGWQESEAEREKEPIAFQIIRHPIGASLVRDLDATRLVREGLLSSFVDPSIVTDDMVVRYTELSRAPGHRDILMQMSLGFHERNFATPERLAPLRTPTLIVLGEQDNVVSPSFAANFNRAIAGSEFVTFANAGHLPHEEVARESADAVRAFLAARVQPSAAAMAAE